VRELTKKSKTTDLNTVCHHYAERLSAQYDKPCKQSWPTIFQQGNQPIADFSHTSSARVSKKLGKSCSKLNFPPPVFHLQLLAADYSGCVTNVSRPHSLARYASRTEMTSYCGGMYVAYCRASCLRPETDNLGFSNRVSCLESLHAACM
jgi:hypothetical protein